MLTDFDLLFTSIDSEPLRIFRDMLNRSRMMCQMNKFSVLCISEIFMVSLQWNKQSEKDAEHTGGSLCLRNLVFQQRKHSLG